VKRFAWNAEQTEVKTAKGPRGGLREGSRSRARNAQHCKI